MILAAGAIAGWIYRGVQERRRARLRHPSVVLPPSTIDPLHVRLRPALYDREHES